MASLNLEEVLKEELKTSSNIPLSVTDITTKTVGSTYKNKIYVSKFLVTVNPNIASKDEGTRNRVITCLKTGFKKAVSKHEKEIFKIKPPATETWGPEHIFSISQQIAAEEGGKFHRIHIHALIEIKHDTLIQIDRKALRQILLDHCKDEAIKNLYVDVKFIPVDKFAELYLRKNPVSTTTGSNSTQ